MLEFVFTDEGNQAVGLQVRRGIAEYIPVSADYYLEADFVIKLESETWAELYLSSIDLGEAIGSKAVTLEKGKVDELVKVFAMFDRYQPAKNVTVPSLDDMTHMVR